jgi:hypothetical protein
MSACFEGVEVVGLLDGDGALSDLRLNLGVLFLQFVLELGV